METQRKVQQACAELAATGMLASLSQPEIHRQGARVLPVTSDTDFLRNHVARFPQLKHDYESHVADNGEPLPHVFPCDVTTAVMHAYNGTGARYADLDWRGLIQYLEEPYPAASLAVQEVIVTSFLFSLPWPAEPGHAITAELGPVLAEKFRPVRPAG